MQYQVRLPETVLLKKVVEERNYAICNLPHIHPLVDEVVDLHKLSLKGSKGQ